MKKNPKIKLWKDRYESTHLKYRYRKHGEFVLEIDSNWIHELADLRWVNLYAFPSLEGPGDLVTIIGDENEIGAWYEEDFKLK